MRVLAAAVLALSTGCVAVTVQQPPMFVAAPELVAPGAEVLVVEQTPPPTAICRDGAYSYSRHRSGTCSHHGGVAQWSPEVPRPDPGWTLVTAWTP